MATGYVQAVNGGGANIIVSQTSAPGKVSIFSSGMSTNYSRFSYYDQVLISNDL